jgi:iron complex outermembrane receptor protein
MRFNHTKTVALALLLSSGSAQAYAQTADAAASQAPAALATSSAAGGDPAGTLEEIVVTATRREERLQDVPISVSAVTSEALAASGVTDVRQVMFAVPGFTGGRNFGVLQPSIRGVGSTGNSVGDESNVAIYVDGIYQPHANGNIVDFVAIDRVEVLRGPQGTLFGRNATGGLVNIITPDPKFTPEVRVNAQYSRFEGADNVGVRGYVTGPITDNLAADLSILYSDTDPYLDDLVRGGKLGDARSLNARGKILYQPSDRAQAILTMGFADQRGGNGNIIAPLDGNTVGNRAPGNIVPNDPYAVALSLRPRFEIKQSTFALRTKFDLGDVALETSSGYLRDKVLQQSDTDASPVVVSQNLTQIYNSTWSHEVRLLSQNESKLQWIAGGYYYYMRGRSRTDSLTGVGPDFSRAVPSVLMPSVRVTSLAAFGEANYEVTEQLKLTLGARYTTESRHFTQTFNGARVFEPREVSDDSITYRATAQYFFAPRSNVYATYSTGFKSGVFNGYGLSPNPVQPETINAIEIGVKSDPLPWLRTNLAFFDYSYDDLQVVARELSATGPATYVLLNAAKAKVRGFDVEVQAALGDHLKISASANVIDPTYDSFPNAQVFMPVPGAPGRPAMGNTTTTADVSGNDLIRAPRYTMSLSADWKQELNGGILAINGTVYRSDRTYFDFGNRLQQPAYTRLNGQVSWMTADEKLRVRLFATNLTDEVIIQQATATPIADQVTYERPREIGVGFEVRF